MFNACICLFLVQVKAPVEDGDNPILCPSFKVHAYLTLSNTQVLL